VRGDVFETVALNTLSDDDARCDYHCKQKRERKTTAKRNDKIGFRTTAAD